MLLLFLGGKRKEETEAEKMYRLLNPIPKENWITDEFTDGKSKCCFIGHYQRLTSGNPESYSTFNCNDYGVRRSIARELTGEFIKKVYKLNRDGAAVNNWKDTNNYTEDNPKDRVMHLLKDMIKAGY